MILLFSDSNYIEKEKSVNLSELSIEDIKNLFAYFYIVYKLLLKEEDIKKYKNNISEIIKVKFDRLRDRYIELEETNEELKILAFVLHDKYYKIIYYINLNK